MSDKKSIRNPLISLIDESELSSSPHIDKPNTINSSENIKLQRQFISWQPDEDAPDIEEDDNEAFYDAHADEQDALYVKLKYRFGSDQTDAVLSCPGCFTPICYQCQRHEQYNHQYRSNSALNCNVEMNETFNFEEISQLITQNTTNYQNFSSMKRSRPATPSESKEAIDNTDTSSSMLYYPVYCSECDHMVAVREKQSDIYHFFDVLPSEA